MKRTITAAVAAATATAGIAFATSAHGAGGTTLHLVDHEGGFAYIDAKPMQLPKKPSLDDQFALKGRLTGDKRGTDGLACTVIATGKAGAELCHGVAHFADGDLFIEGRSSDAGNGDTYAVSGGTRAYLGATGTVVTRNGNGKTTKITITLEG